MWSQLSEDVQAWDSKPDNKDTYAAVLNIIELLQDKADEAHLSAAAKGLLPVLEAAIVADRIPTEHLPAARRALERFQAVQVRARQVEAEPNPEPGPSPSPTPSQVGWADCLEKTELAARLAGLQARSLGP